MSATESSQFKYSEGCNTCRRVYYHAARLDGLSTRDATREAAAATKRLFPEEHLEASRRWHRKCQSKMKQEGEFAARRRAQGRLQASRNGARKLGHAPLSFAVEDLMAQMAKGICDCCGGSFKAGSDCCADHDHVTGQFRGVLCRNCNLAEGYLKTAARARQLLAYMEKHGA
jgi:hypothetical protein